MNTLPSRTTYVVTGYNRSGCVDGRSAEGPTALRRVVRRMFAEGRAERVEVGRVAGGKVVDERTLRSFVEADEL